MVVDHDAALELGHGRAGLGSAIERVGQGRGGVQPACSPAMRKPVSSRQRTGAAATHTPMPWWTGAALRPCGGPSRHARAAGRRRPEQILQDLRGSFLGHELLGVEIDGRRLDALAILGRRNDALGEVGAGPQAAGRAVVDRRAVLGHDQRLLRKIEHLPRLPADLGIRQKPRLAMLADLGRMLDDRVGFGDLAQRVAAMAFLASARLARARAQALQNPRLLLQPVARRRLGAVGAVQIQTSPKLGVLGPKRLDLASERIDQLHDFERKNHSTLESKSAHLSRKIATPQSIVRLVWLFGGSPRLGSYRWHIGVA